MLLLDEPLGALDLKLREQMQVELKEIQRDLGITFIFVTHDQEEALTLSDRIAVFNDGRIEQLGTPAELYERPALALRRRLRRHVEPLRRRALAQHPRPRRPPLGAPREDDASPATASTGDGVVNVPGTVVEAIYLGSGVRLVVDLDDGTRVTVLEQNDRDRVHDDERGDRVVVSWHDDDVVHLGTEVLPGISG